MKNENNIPFRNNISHSDSINAFKYFPKQLDDVNIRFIKVKPHGKEAVEKNWQTSNNYSMNSSEILNWVRSGGNYGITSPFGFCCFIDADTKEIQNALDSKLPKTLRWSTGKKDHYQYAYFIEDSPIGCVPLKGGAYIKGKGGYVLGPGSIHPNGVTYGSREIRDVPIAIVKREDLLKALNQFVEGKENTNRKTVGGLPKGNGEILLVLKKYKVDVTQFRQAGEWLRGSHPVHGSETGTNFEINVRTNGWHCFRHNTGGGIVSLIAVLEGFTKCEEVKDGKDN